MAIISYNRSYCPSVIADDRWNLYEIGSEYPSVVFDGTDKVFEQNQNAYLTTYDAHIQAAKTDTPQYKLELNAVASPSAGEVQLKIITTDTIPVATIITHIAVCQDSIPGFTLDYYNHVCQQLYTFTLGLAYPDTLDTTIVFSHALPIDQMSAVVFIQNMDTRKIMHAITKHFEEAP